MSLIVQRECALEQSACAQARAGNQLICRRVSSRSSSAVLLRLSQPPLNTTRPSLLSFSGPVKVQVRFGVVKADPPILRHVNSTLLHTTVVHAGVCQYGREA